jgi:peptidyl-prolyl cis-trans isomerase D
MSFRWLTATSRRSDAGQLNPEMLKAFRFDRQIMDALVTRHVMTEEAKRLGLNASPAEIEQKILENPVFRENGAFIGQTRYQAILAQNNLSIEEFENDVANEIKTDKLRSFVAGAVLVTDKEAEEEYKRRNEKAKIDFFIIDSTKLEGKISPADQELHEYYDKNKTKYTVNEKRKAKYIFLSSLKLRSQITVSDDELRQYYEQHKNEYILPERLKAQHILSRLQENLRKSCQLKIKCARFWSAKRRRLWRPTGNFRRLTASAGGISGNLATARWFRLTRRRSAEVLGAIGDLVKRFSGHAIEVNGKREITSAPLKK